MEQFESLAGMTGSGNLRRYRQLAFVQHFYYICVGEYMNTLSQLFRTLADNARLRILNLLFESGELCVCDIESTLRFTQTKVSRHMRYLKRAKLVQDRKQGRWVLYKIAMPKSGRQRIIIERIRDILQSSRQAKKDIARFRKNTEQGCCATLALVNQQEQCH